MSRSLATLSKLTRWRLWYRDKAALFLACLYYSALSRRALDLSAISEMASLLLLFCCLAAFGHMVNSLSDQEIDRAAGKHCPLAAFSPRVVLLLVAAPAVLGLAVAAFLYAHRPDVLLLLVVSFAAGTFYSLPPLRLKERGCWGLFTAAIAQRTLPAMIAFQAMNAWDWTAASFCALSTLIGLNGIFWHQLLDQKNDKANGVRTFVVDHGETFARLLLGRRIFPLEVIAFFSTAFLMSRKLPLVGIAATLYAAWVALHILMGRQKYRRRVTESFDVFANFYNLIWPLLLAALLLERNLSFWVVFVFTYIWLFFEEAGVPQKIARAFPAAFRKKSGVLGLAAISDSADHKI